MTTAGTLRLLFILLFLIPACVPTQAPANQPTAAPPTKFASVPTSPPPATQPTRSATRAPSATRTSALALKTSPTPTPKKTNTPTRIPTLAGTATPGTGAVIPPSVFAALHNYPSAMLASQTAFFTSVCYGKDANLLQDQDYIEKADWPTSRRNKCVFGYGVNTGNRQPTGHYTVLEGPDGQSRFYLIPPEAFSRDPQSIKELSQMQLIVDPEQGCASLGSIGITADGLNYQCDACSFLSAGGVCPTTDGSKRIVLPTNKNNILDPADNGGAYGFLAFPAVIFRKDFSLYFTGNAGYAPRRIYFENIVDTLFPNVNVKTTAEMTDQEISYMASQFDNLLSGTDPKSQLASVELEARSTTPSLVTVKSKQEVVFGFTTKPGAVLSSIAWKIKPVIEIRSNQYMETNACLDINGREYCFTGVEDFAHCAFFATCTTGYSSLKSMSGGGYIATRYFPAGTAPVINDGRVTIRIQAPDIGTILEMEVKVRVRNVDSTLTR